MTIFRENPALLEGFRAGEREAMEKIYHHYAREVEIVVKRGFTTRKGDHVPGVRSDADARDLMQECFVRAFGEKVRSSFDGDRAFRPYLLSIVRNLMVDRLRGAFREVLSDENGVDIDAHIEANRPISGTIDLGPEERIRWKRLREAYEKYGATLSDEELSFVRLRYEDELSQRDVAMAMDITRRRSRTLENRIHAGFKKFLRKEKLL